MTGSFTDLKNDAGLPLIEGTVEKIVFDTISLRLSGTNYAPTFLIQGGVPQVGEKISGVVRLHARRMDLPVAGGRYVEPLSGRPRRIQGRVIAVDGAKNEVHVRAGFTVVATPLAPQKASDFLVGQTVSFDAEPNAMLEMSSSVHH